MAMLARGNPATARRQDGDWTAALPETVTFEAIAAPTADDRARVAGLASVTRNTWGPDANLTGTCFDFATGGPDVVIVESGLLRVSVFDPQNPASTPPEAVAHPTVFLAERDHAPEAAPPDTQHELRPGEAVVFPDGANCGKYGQEGDVTFLEVTLLPGEPDDPWMDEDLGMTGEVVEIGLGPDAAAALPAIIAGRLRIEAGGALPLDELGMPLALFLETGEVRMNATHDGALGRDVAFAETDPSVLLASGREVTLVAGNSAYIPATATGTVTAVGAVSCLLVALDVAAAASAG
jgi:hypothetical protein